MKNNKKIYVLEDQYKNAEGLKAFLESNPDIKFISVVSVDYGNNHTDEKIPISSVITNLKDFLENGVQTDGSSNHLPKIATINNAKVDLIPDKNAVWLVEYNKNHLLETGNPCATLQIPAFIKHEDNYVCSRTILKRAVERFKKELVNIIYKNPNLANDLILDDSTDCNQTKLLADDIQEIIITIATELEFWVKSPDSKTEIEKLTTSQSLKEQYWKRTVGPVRDALEKSLLAMEKYQMHPEMGHKEVGGVTSRLAGTNLYSHVMEQLEINWKYDRALNCADRELFVKDLVKEIFESHGLRVTFQAKPAKGVAGSGEHHHMGVKAILKNGKTVNLFHPKNQENYISKIGYGFLMGILVGYELISPFISFTTDSLNRLKPGYEAPVCTVASLGNSPELPSRNRTVLIALLRETDNHHATRFELRSPNCSSNTYLLVAACLQFALFGIESVSNTGYSTSEIAAGFSKGYGDDHFLLEKNRIYRSEEDIYKAYSPSERNKYFGIAPQTVYENLVSFDNRKDLHPILEAGGIFTQKTIASFKAYMLEEWSIELTDRIIPNNHGIINRLSRLNTDNLNQLDNNNWTNVIKLKTKLVKDDVENQSVFTQIKNAISQKEYNLASKLQIQMNEDMEELLRLHSIYRKNIFL